MDDFFEIDFLDVGSNKSGDAIPLRYVLNGRRRIHVIDGGYQDTGEKVEQHIKGYYKEAGNEPEFIDSVIVTHPDGDHAGGLRTILEKFEIGELWMLRPWIYADELIDRFSRFTSVENLIQRLKDIYPSIVALEELAEKHDIPIYEPLQGAKIGQFTVLSPTRSRYLDLVVESDKTPESAKNEPQKVTTSISAYIEKVVAKTTSFIKAAWGIETFSSEETRPENEMSVIQYANLCDNKILLTGDAGRGALSEAADYAPSAGLSLPGIDYFQVPHHGSRRNVSSDILDRWLGPKLPDMLAKGKKKSIACISAAKEDEDHPRKVVIRAMIHRGANVITTEGRHLRAWFNAPEREGWITATPIPYPEEQEDS